MSKPSSVLICRCKSRIAFLNYAILAAMPFALFGLSLYALHLHGWRIFVAVFPFGVLAGVFAFVYGAERARLRRSSLEIDTLCGVFTFRHFRFVAAFLPEKPREEETVRFDEVLDARHIEVQKGIGGIRVRTLKGRVTISEEMEHFESIVAAFGTAAEANQASPDEFRRKLEAEPKIKTPWFGWLILFVAVLIVGLTGWHAMYAE